MSFITDLDQLFQTYGEWWCSIFGLELDSIQLGPVPGFEQYALQVPNASVQLTGEETSTISAPQPTSATVSVNNASATPEVFPESLVWSDSETYTLTLQQGFKLSIAETTKVTYEVLEGPTLEESITITTEVNWSSTEAQSSTQIFSRTEGVTLTVPPHSTMTATLYASKQAVSQQFAGTAELAGYIGTKLKGDYKGSSVWFHPVTDVFNQFPQMGWTPDDESGTVSFSGNGTFNGLMQLATQWELSDGTIAPVTQSSQREEIVAS